MGCNVNGCEVTPFSVMVSLIGPNNTQPLGMGMVLVMEGGFISFVFVILIVFFCVFDSKVMVAFLE